MAFNDPSATFGRPHRRDKFPIGPKAHSLMAITGVPLVSSISGRNALEQNHLFPLSAQFGELFPDLKIAYLVLDWGYDSEGIHRPLYEDYAIIPMIIRKKIRSPKGF